QQTVTKGNFPIGVFITHTQSGDSSGDASTRASQFSQLSVSINLYRALNPTHPIIVMGDFNASDSSAEYTSNMLSSLGNIAHTGDVAVNRTVNSDGTQCTTCANNVIRQAFGGSGNSRIDYILYGYSADGHVRLIPKRYDVRTPRAANAISGAGWDPESFSDFTLTTTLLSDHEAIYAEFDLVRE
ncbi:MAG: endonuclease/exonuclease/phosphatase family protein, partial [Phycisphaerales bacterium]